jgi:hypothetical protein
MQSFFNDLVDWPVIFAKWLPDVVQEAGVLQRCPSCKASACFELLLDWHRSGSGLCYQCGYVEGLEWLKLAYQISSDTAKQIVRGEIDSAAELIPLRQPKLNKQDDPNELLVAQRLKGLYTLAPGVNNAGIQYFKRLGILLSREVQDVYFDPEVTLARLGKKPLQCCAILLVVRNNVGRRVGVESIYLTDDGSHIDVAPCPIKARAEKAMLGTSVRLSALQPTVLVAVSIESAFALHARFPDQAVVAAFVAERLKALQLPDFVCNVILIVKPHSADADAAIELAKRLENKGCFVRIAHDFKTTEQACYQASIAEVC